MQFFDLRNSAVCYGFNFYVFTFVLWPQGWHWPLSLQGKI